MSSATKSFGEVAYEGYWGSCEGFENSRQDVWEQAAQAVIDAYKLSLANAEPKVGDRVEKI